MSVESFDPGARKLPLDRTVIEELLEAAGHLGDENCGLEQARIAALATVARHGEDCDWGRAAAELAPAELERLIRLFTRAETLPGWESGPRSPVIPLAAELKKRGEYPPELTRWIKANTENRFLPYGSLMDRL